MTGVLNVRKNAGSIVLFEASPRQYCPGARLAMAIVLVKLSVLLSVAVPPLEQVPATPTENE